MCVVVLFCIWGQANISYLVILLCVDFFLLCVCLVRKLQKQVINGSLFQQGGNRATALFCNYGLIVAAAGYSLQELS